MPPPDNERRPGEGRRSSTLDGCGVETNTSRETCVYQCEPGTCEWTCAVPLDVALTELVADLLVSP